MPTIPSRSARHRRPLPGCARSIRTARGRAASRGEQRGAVAGRRHVRRCSVVERAHRLPALDDRHGPGPHRGTRTRCSSRTFTWRPRTASSRWPRRRTTTGSCSPNRDLRGAQDGGDELLAVQPPGQPDGAGGVGPAGARRGRAGRIQASGTGSRSSAAFRPLGPSGAEIRLGLQQGPTDDQVRVGGRSVAGRKRRPEEGYGDLGI
jgi:hypothetical protein